MQTLEEHTDDKAISGGYRVERFSVDKLNDLVYLHMAVYGKLLSRDFLLKKYNTAFTVVTYIGFLAYDQTDLPVAFYGVLPCFVEHGGRLTLAAQSADTMTQPEHRNKGLFVALANQTYSLCRAEGIRLIFGFPNQNSLPGFINKLGWEAVGCLERFTIPVKAIPLEKFATKFNVAKPFYDAYLKLVIKAEKKPSGINNSVLAEGYGGVYRDEEFLTYKAYTYTHTVQVGQARVWFKIKNGLIVGDITGLADNMDEVMAKLLKLTKRLGLQQLQFQVCAKSRLYAMLKKYGEPIPSFTVAIKDMGSGIPADKLAFTFADIDIF
ncbi:GNAT family N-acetyltransferase [Mucilaginibacter gilvus]|uniref:GNAT family N-acetyltransferase n=1 Tax=Mucilaginibacter gilvus TaxID=2305909 RepID=A0A3S3V1A9_9SPHI|nr:GNAT family N-acetyltransferase [Mucilaginibacter gilvus]RWY55700.1 GNAT family N-acetyltransferase [Mucilaginibacter gilvus]